VSALDDAPLFQPADRAAWRTWLEANHATAAGVWLVSWRRPAGRPTIAYEEAIEEALCFGWVDGTAGRVDDERGKLYFARRRPSSPWAASNKARVERLVAAGLMAPAGLAAVERAKADGSWTVLDGPERLEVPPDLATALDATPPAAANWAAWPPSARKLTLGWIAVAKRPATRAARIERTAEMAARDVRPDRPGGWPVG
jgi:uncharacterized protein YdeI (YjbR/CyaY-like superfamily)